MSGLPPNSLTPAAAVAATAAFGDADAAHPSASASASAAAPASLLPTLPDWLLNLLRQEDDGNLSLHLDEWSQSLQQLSERRQAQQQQLLAFLRLQPPLIDAVSLTAQGEHDPLLAALCDSRAISSVSIDCQRLSRSDLGRLIGSLPYWSALQQLHLHSLRMTPVEFASICRSRISSSLTSLSFTRCDLTADCLQLLLAQLQQPPLLRSLNLSDNKRLLWQPSDSFQPAIPTLLELLTVCDSLTELDLSHCGIDHGLAMRLLPALAEHKPQLRKLNLGGWRLTSMSGVHSLPSLSWFASLHVLELAECKLTAGDMASLAPTLRALPALTRLVINANPIGESGVTALLPALVDSHLEELGLNNCELTLTSLHRLVGALRQMPAMRSLDLSHNPLLVKARGNPPFHAFSNLLANSPNLTSLDLRQLKLKTQHTVDLAVGVRRHPSLTRLELLSRDSLKTQGVLSLATAVAEGSDSAADGPVA